MGRWETGAITTGQCLQIHIGSFAEHIKKETPFLVGSINYNSGASISVKLIKIAERYEVELSYYKTVNGERKDINYRVKVVSVPSNLGKGEVYYFFCPFSYHRCKVLYMGYGSPYYKSRKAYSLRIYYPSQLSSHLDRHNDKYWRLDKELEQLKNKHPKRHYRGQPTKALERIERLEREKMYHDRKRWEVMPKAIVKSMAQYGLTDTKGLF